MILEALWHCDKDPGASYPIKYINGQLWSSRGYGYEPLRDDVKTIEQLIESMKVECSDCHFDIIKESETC